VEPTPSKGRPHTKFVGLEEPPIDLEGGGLEVVLTSDQLHGLDEGSGIFYRGINVGAIDAYELDKDGGGVLVHATVEKKYAELVHENSRFYNASGIDITASLSQGFEFDMESLRTLLAGGVELDTPGKPGPAAKNGARFELRRHPHAAGKGGHAPPSGPRFVLEAPTRGSVKTGDAVLYREEQVGQVVSHALHDDGRSVGILVAIESRYAPLVRANTIFWNASGISADLGLTGLHIHTESLESLLEGGIAFATPSKPGTRAAAGSVFKLHDKAPKDWVKWAPRVALGSRGGGKAPAEPEEKIHHDEEAKADPESHHWFHHLFH
jgi:paraquat-inducible protein B